MTLERARLAVFWLLAAWMLLSPAWVQIVRGNPRWVRGWQMYSSSGVGTCDVRYYVRDAEGKDTLIPRLATLHPDKPWYSVPDAARQLEKSEVPRTGQQLCAILRAQDVRAYARCASSRGWRNEAKRETNLCSSARRKP